MGPGRRLRVFLDSNVLFSALYSRHGAPNCILELATQGKIASVISPMVLGEVVQALREKFPVAIPALKRLLETSTLEMVRNASFDDAKRWSETIDRDDAAILAAAVAAQPDYLVTGDKHFFGEGIAEKSGLRIVTPAEFLGQFEAALDKAQ